MLQAAYTKTAAREVTSQCFYSDTISHNILFQIFYIYSYLIRHHVLIASALGFDIYISFIVIITKMD